MTFNERISFKLSCMLWPRGWNNVSWQGYLPDGRMYSHGHHIYKRPLDRYRRVHHWLMDKHKYQVFIVPDLKGGTSLYKYMICTHNPDGSWKYVSTSDKVYSRYNNALDEGLQDALSRIPMFRYFDDEEDVIKEIMKGSEA